MLWTRFVRLKRLEVACACFGFMAHMRYGEVFLLEFKIGFHFAFSASTMALILTAQSLHCALALFTAE